MGSGINYKRDDYMVKKLLDIVNKYFKEVIIIDDSIYDNSTIYKLIDTLFLNKLSHYLPYILTDEDMDFLANFACKDIPKPRNLSEQLKYMKLCADFNFIEKIITDNVEIGKGYDISGCPYIICGEVLLVDHGKIVNNPSLENILTATIENNILTIHLLNEDITGVPLCSVSFFVNLPPS